MNGQTSAPSTVLKFPISSDFNVIGPCSQRIPPLLILTDSPSMVYLQYCSSTHMNFLFQQSRFSFPRSCNCQILFLSTSCSLIISCSYIMFAKSSFISLVKLNILKAIFELFIFTFFRSKMFLFVVLVSVSLPLCCPSQILGNSWLSTVLVFWFPQREPEKVVQVVYLKEIIRSIVQGVMR